jgi:hypothetical protein
VDEIVVRVEAVEIHGVLPGRFVLTVNLQS